MHRALLALLLSWAAAGPALAGPAAGSGGGEGDARPPEPTVEVSNLPIPVVAGGRLVNYCFVTITLTLAPGQDQWAMRDKGHFLRDEVLRIVNGADYALAGRIDQIDTARLTPAILAASNRILGQGVVARVSYGRVSPMRRSQARPA